MLSFKTFFALFITWIISLSAYAFTASPTPHTLQVTALVNCHLMDLPTLVFWICLGIGLIVFAAFMYCLIAHYHSCKVKATDLPKQSRLEILWAIVPFIILLALVVPATHHLVSNCTH